MIRDRGEGDSVLLISAPNNQNLQVIGYAEFMRRMTKEGPPEGSDPGQCWRGRTHIHMHVRKRAAARPSKVLLPYPAFLRTPR